MRASRGPLPRLAVGTHLGAKTPGQEAREGTVGVSVVIPCRNEKDSIEACVRSVLAQESPPGGFEIVVADGISDDGTREILDRLAVTDPRLRVIENPGRVVSTGLNAAIGSVRGGIIVRMDAHTHYAPDYLCQCVAVLRETGADNVGGPWVAKGKGYLSRGIAAVFQSAFAVGGARGHNPRYEGRVDTVYLGCWPREVFDRVGFFDEDLVRNQDDEFNLRLTRAGGKVWQSPRVRSWYEPRNSLLALCRQYKQYGYWKVRVIQKHKLPASVRHLVPGLFVLALLVLPLPGLWWPLAAWGWLGLSGAYAVGNVAASLLTAARNGWTLLPLLPVVFACYHFAYGYGFLRGIWDFVLWRRGPDNTYSEITRSTA
jgi:succinoglycan biosynthesis protein ExoA